MKHGSHLYGTNTPESDLDIKGVYLPSIEECILGTVKKQIDLSTNKGHSKNTKDDVDEKYYSLQYFLKLAIEGQTEALDMLHAPLEDCEIVTPEWRFLHNHRHLFYTKNLESYVGYCKHQAAKYGIKGSRLSALKDVISCLEDMGDYNATVKGAWDYFKGQFKDNEHVHFYMDEVNNIEMFEVCGKKFQNTSRLEYILLPLRKMYTNYGERARQAEANEGIDWKAISHAFRAGLQLKEIYETGDLKYPLKDAEFLLKLKQGKYHYKNDRIGEKLEELIDDINRLAKKSSYPEEVDKVFFDEVITLIYRAKDIETELEKYFKNVYTAMALDFEPTMEWLKRTADDLGINTYCFDTKNTIRKRIMKVIRKKI